jgi:hypothetical protein
MCHDIFDASTEGNKTDKKKLRIDSLLLDSEALCVFNGGLSGTSKDMCFPISKCSQFLSTFYTTTFSRLTKL